MTLRFLTALAATALAGLAAAQGLVLVIDSANDKVLSFDPTTGQLQDANFIPDLKALGGTGGSYTPKSIVDSTRGTLFVADQIQDAVFEYSYTGQYLGTVAGAAQGLDNIRGMAINNGRLFVTVGGNAGGLNNTVQSFNLNGGDRQTFINTGLSSPFDVLFRGNDVLVSNSSGTADIQRYDLNGNLLGTFHSGAISFAQQLNLRANGNVIAAGFSPTSGVYEYDSNGNQVGFYANGSGPRGVYELGDGRVM